MIITVTYTSRTRDGRARFTSEAAYREWLTNHPEYRIITIYRDMK